MTLLIQPVFYPKQVLFKGGDTAAAPPPPPPPGGGGKSDSGPATASDTVNTK